MADRSVQEAWASYTRLATSHTEESILGTFCREITRSRGAASRLAQNNVPRFRVRWDENPATDRIAHSSRRDNRRRSRSSGRARGRQPHARSSSLDREAVTGPVLRNPRPPEHRQEFSAEELRAILESYRTLERHIDALRSVVAQ